MSSRSTDFLEICLKLKFHLKKNDREINFRMRKFSFPDRFRWKQQNFYSQPNKAVNQKKIRI